MVSRVKTVAFIGITTVIVDVQVHVSSGLPSFNIVGLPHKSISESKSRIEASLSSLGIGMPSKKITVNLSPADLPKEGSYYDLPIVAAILHALDLLPDEIANYLTLGELSLDGSLADVHGVLAVASKAYISKMRGIIVPRQNAVEATWIEGIEVIAPKNLLQLINHFKGSFLPEVVSEESTDAPITTVNMRDIYGQQKAKRGLEIAAAGRHHVLMIGPPGVGKSALCGVFPSLVPPLLPRESLELSIITSIKKRLPNGQLIRLRPFRAPHHTASHISLVGGGHDSRPGEVSLAHGGILFLDEIAEFSRCSLDAMRQPLEDRKINISRHKISAEYPADFQLLAAMNPCRCNSWNEEGICSRGVSCTDAYQRRIPSPIMDRVDIRLYVSKMDYSEMKDIVSKEANNVSSEDILSRVIKTWNFQKERNKFFNIFDTGVTYNKDLQGENLRKVCFLDSEAQKFFDAHLRSRITSTRDYVKLIRLSRTIADMQSSMSIEYEHLAEAAFYRFSSFSSRL